MSVLLAMFVFVLSDPARWGGFAIPFVHPILFGGNPYLLLRAALAS